MSSEVLVSIDPMLPYIFPIMDPNDGVKDNIEPDAAWHFYSHSIKINPTDLKLHTQRVFFAMQHKDATLLPGSLHDLFFILKDAGVNPRIRLLKASAPYMSKEDILYFARWMKLGIGKGMGYQWTPGAMLSNGLYGPDQTLFTMSSLASTQTELSPLEEARSCMEYGQLDVAQKILENALEHDSENQTLRKELDYLRQYNKSKQIQPTDETPESQSKKAESVSD